uniref:Uncharacterized protein n=1 Tax=Anguilla anguilla TaxID=7936 RepID=A0A0E9URD4_ANGAN
MILVMCSTFQTLDYSRLFVSLREGTLKGSF